jgi:ABC-type antimicrobial peptide transport system permease subunit
LTITLVSLIYIFSLEQIKVHLAVYLILAFGFIILIRQYSSLFIKKGFNKKFINFLYFLVVLSLCINLIIQNSIYPLQVSNRIATNNEVVILSTVLILLFGLSFSIISKFRERQTFYFFVKEISIVAFSSLVLLLTYSIVSYAYLPRNMYLLECKDPSVQRWFIDQGGIGAKAQNYYSAQNFVFGVKNNLINDISNIQCNE